MNKTVRILKWIFFIPLSFLGAALSMLIIRFIDPYSHTPIGIIWHPIVWNIAFFLISFYLIPSDAEKKIKIPLIILFLLNSLAVISFLLAIVFGRLEIITNNLWSIIGSLISFCFICYYLFFKNGQDKIREWLNG
jgi:nitric oxide reductase large subunit